MPEAVGGLGAGPLRMRQNRHRYVSQAMLDLKRLFWNCRRFSHGKRRKACPYELLGLDLPTYNWWKLLQMDPEELRQQLSASIIASATLYANRLGNE